ncbi:MAG TPA: betaine-aldehyde dehydrogenase, partial [Gammaproteobacteria bacterium]|nr:betaine-aldehyde dehydrogenase [Gammaproteobacteria bacterium]
MLKVKGHPVPRDHYINGEWITGEEFYTVFSPIDEAPLGEMPKGTEEHVEAAI